MKKTLFVASLFSAVTLLTAAPAAKTAQTAAPATPSVTAQNAAKAGFDAKLWSNAEFNMIGKVGKTTWKIAEGKAPAAWELRNTKGVKEFTLVPVGKNDFFAKIKNGCIAKDLKKVGEKNIFHFRYKGKGSAYMYVIRYNKKTNSNLPSRLFKHLKNVDIKEWKDETCQVDIPVHKDGERRVFWFWAYDGEFDVDSIYLTVK